MLVKINAYPHAYSNASPHAYPHAYSNASPHASLAPPNKLRAILSCWMLA